MICACVSHFSPGKGWDEALKRAVEIADLFFLLIIKEDTIFQERIDYTIMG